MQPDSNYLMMKKVLIVKRADLEFDIRCQRIGTHLSRLYDVTILGTDLSSRIPIKQVKIADYDNARLSIPERAVRKFRREILLRKIQDKPFEYRFNKDKWTLELSKHLNSNQYHVVIACDMDSIASFLNSSSNAKLIGDLHEHAPTELANSPGWIYRVGDYRKWQCETFLPDVEELFTVSTSLARLYESEFSLPKVNVLRNVAPYNQRHRPASNLKPLKFIHHGIAAPVRGLEEHATLAASLGSEYSVSMLLKPVDFEYYKFLKETQKVVKNFHVLEPVQPIDMISQISRFDAGVYLLNPSTRQLEVTLPNKFFEFIQARLPVFSGGLKEIDELIDQYGVGLKLGTFDGIEASRAIKSNQDLDWKAIHDNLDFAAKALSSEEEFKKISLKIEQLLVN